MKSVWMIYNARENASAPGGYDFGFPIKQVAFETNTDAIEAIRADWERFVANGDGIANNLDGAFPNISFKLLNSVWTEYVVEIAVHSNSNVDYASAKKIRIKRKQFA